MKPNPPDSQTPARELEIYIILIGLLDDFTSAAWKDKRTSTNDVKTGLEKANAKLQAYARSVAIGELEKFKQSKYMQEHKPFTKSKSSARHAQNKLRYILWEEIDNIVAELKQEGESSDE